MANPEVESMKTQSTMPAKVEEVQNLPSLSIEVHRMEITAAQLRQYFAPANATSADIGFFIAMAKSLGLNPWKRELHMVPFYDPTGARKYAAVVGYEVYLGRAEDSKKLDGWETEFDDEDKPTKCTITIWRKDWTHPFSHTTYMDEVMKLKKNGEPMATWATQPRFQLKKCTIAQGMRMCIPACAGLPYTFEEQAIISHDMTQDMPVEPIQIESAQLDPEVDALDVEKEKASLEEFYGKIWANARRLGYEKEEVYTRIESEWKQKVSSLKELSDERLSGLFAIFSNDVLKAEAAIAEGIGVSIAELRQRAEDVYGSRYKLPLDTSEEGIEKVTDDINKYLDEQEAEPTTQRLKKVEVYASKLHVDVLDMAEFLVSKYGENPPLDIESEAGLKALGLEFKSWLDEKVDEAAAEEPEDDLPFHNSKA